MAGESAGAGAASSRSFEFPALLADIGGTNARLAVLVEPGGEIVALPRLLTAALPDPIAAIREALQAYTGPPPRSALLAVAAPVEDLIVKLVNAGWTVDPRRIAEEFGFAQVMLLNDYTPVAVALVGLEENDLAVIGPRIRPANGPKLVLGPGTGLGVAALVPAGDRFCVVSGEAGHIEFGPVSQEEAAVWAHLERVQGRVTAESVLSGPGLLRLYRALAAVRGETGVLSQPSHVQVAGQSGTNRRAAEALEWFARLLGRYAGDLALVLNAGAVYLASGIAPRMLDELGRGGFRDAFERKAPHQALMRRTPTWVVTNPEPAFVGLALIATHPGRFVFEAQRFSRT